MNCVDLNILKNAIIQKFLIVSYCFLFDKLSFACNLCLDGYIVLVCMC